MKKIIPSLLALVLLLVSAQVFAKALVTFSSNAEKEVTVNKETKRVAVSTVNPGDEIIYTLNYVNSGDDVATNAVLDDAIPKDTIYINGSAFGDNAEIFFSIDGGKTFKKPSLLAYEVKLPGGKTEKKNASPEQYTNIRWTVSSIPAHGSGKVGFQVKVK